MRSNWLNCALSLIVLAAASSAVHAAPFTNRGPGGMGTTDGTSNLRMWYKSDTNIFSNTAGTTPAANTGVVQNWDNLATASNTGVYTGTSPTPPTYLTGQADFNGRPVLEFTDGQPQTTPAPNQGDSLNLGSYTFTGNETAFFALNFSTPSSRGIIANQGVNRGWDGGNSGMFESTSFAFANNYFVNGVDTPTTSTANPLIVTGTANPFSGAASPLLMGAGHGGNIDYGGRLAEVAIFNTVLNAAQQSIAENYLSSGYNIGVGGGSDKSLAAGDHYNGDLAAKGNFDFDVFGVGRASDSSLQLNGGMAGFGMEIGTPGSEAWALAGHTNGSNGVTTADVPNTASRWERSWYVDTTGTVGAVNLAFDWNHALNTAAFDPGMVGLYYRSGNSGPFLLLAVGTLDSINQRVDFTGITLSDEFNYTLGSLPVPEPSTFALFGLGAIGLAVKARRRRVAA